jgi:hypothetical protein
MTHWAEELPKFLKDHSALQNACLAISAVRMAEEEPAMMDVQIAMEMWIGNVYLYHLYDGEAFQARVNRKGKEWDVQQANADAAEATAAHYKKLLAEAIDSLHDNRPDQFTALNLSDNNIIDLELI